MKWYLVYVLYIGSLILIVWSSFNMGKEFGMSQEQLEQTLNEQKEAQKDLLYVYNGFGTYCYYGYYPQCRQTPISENYILINKECSVYD